MAHPHSREKDRRKNRKKRDLLTHTKKDLLTHTKETYWGTKETYWGRDRRKHRRMDRAEDR